MSTKKIFKSKYIIPGILVLVLLFVLMNTNFTSIFQSSQEEYNESSRWRKMKGRLVNISVQGNFAAGVSPNGAMYYTSNLNGGNWVKVKGSRFKQVELINGFQAYAIKRGGRIYYTPMIRSGQWYRIPGWASFISVDKGKLVAIGRGNAIYTLNHGLSYQPGVPNIPPELTFAPQPGINPPQVVQLRQVLKTLLKERQSIQTQMIKVKEAIEIQRSTGNNDQVSYLVKEYEALSKEYESISRRTIEIEKQLQGGIMYFGVGE